MEALFSIKYCDLKVADRKVVGISRAGFLSGRVWQKLSDGWRTEGDVRASEPHLLVEKWDETDIGYYDKWALYNTQYPVIYLNKYTKNILSVFIKTSAIKSKR